MLSLKVMQKSTLLKNSHKSEMKKIWNNLKPQPDKSLLHLPRTERPKLPAPTRPGDSTKELLKRSVPVPDNTKYYPGFWNDGDRIQLSTNCYAYSIGCYKNPLTGGYFLRAGEGRFALQPGDLSNKPLPAVRSRYIIQNCKEDAKATGGIFIEATPETPKPEGAWKVALVVDLFTDYHWYRENPDGTWSHKPGSHPVTKLDASGKLIRDPQKCDRHYGTINYREFAGYFYVKPGKIINISKSLA